MNKLTVDFRADKKNPVWVHVWDSEFQKSKNEHRIALEVYSNGKITCVVSCNSANYLNNKEYSTCTWKHHEILPEKKQVPYTVEELHDLGANRIKKASGDIEFIIGFCFKIKAININNYFYKIEVLIKNGWQWTSDTESPFVWHPFVREV